MTERKTYTIEEAEEYRKRLAVGAKEGDRWQKYASDDWWIDDACNAIRKMHAMMLQFMVKVSDITEQGFWMDTYRGRFYISREKNPVFQNATDSELQDVRLFPSEDGDFLYWNALDFRTVVEVLADNNQ